MLSAESIKLNQFPARCDLKKSSSGRDLTSQLDIGEDQCTGGYHVNPMTWYDRTLKTFDPIEMIDDRKKMEEMSREFLELKPDGKRAAGPTSHKTSTEDKHFYFFGYTLSGEWEDVYYAILYGEGLLNSNPFGFTEYLSVPFEKRNREKSPQMSERSNRSNSAQKKSRKRMHEQIEIKCFNGCDRT